LAAPWFDSWPRKSRITIRVGDAVLWAAAEPPDGGPRGLTPGPATSSMNAVIENAPRMAQSTGRGNVRGSHRRCPSPLPWSEPPLARLQPKTDSSARPFQSPCGPAESQCNRRVLARIHLPYYRPPAPRIDPVFERPIHPLPLRAGSTSLSVSHFHGSMGALQIIRQLQVSKFPPAMGVAILPRGGGGGGGGGIIAH